MARRLKELWMRDWLFEQRKAHGYSSAKALLTALEAAGIHIGYSDYASYESPNPDSRAIERKPDLVKRLSGFYGVPLPMPPAPPASESPTDALVPALRDQTAAITRLAESIRLGFAGLDANNQDRAAAITDFLARLEAGLLPADTEVGDERPEIGPDPAAKHRAKPAPRRTGRARPGWDELTDATMESRAR